MIAVGHDGTVYYLSISDGERFDNNIRAEYNALYSKYKNEDNVLQILSKKYGWGYSKQ